MLIKTSQATTLLATLSLLSFGLGCGSDGATSSGNSITGAAGAASLPSNGGGGVSSSASAGNAGSLDAGASSTAGSANVDPALVITLGLALFGVLFALNSALHSYLILSYSEDGKVAMSVGFYYMANAAGRLAGTVLSGALYQWRGLEACLWASVAFVIAASVLSCFLPVERAQAAEPAPGLAI